MFNKIGRLREPMEKPCERSTSDNLLVRMASLTSVASEMLTGELYLGACSPKDLVVYWCARSLSTQVNWEIYQSFVGWLRMALDSVTSWNHGKNRS